MATPQSSVGGAGYPSPYPGQNSFPSQQQQQGNPAPSRPQTQPGASAGMGSGATQGQGASMVTPEEPGFFGRLFGGKKVPEASAATPTAGGAASSLQPAGSTPGQQPPVDIANSAGCCASKPMDDDSAKEFRNAELGLSRFGFLNPPPGSNVALSEDLAVPPPGAPGVPGAPRPPGAAPLTQTPQTGPAPDIKSYGPFLRFGGYDPLSNAYYASVLVVAHQCKGTVPPTLKFCDVDVNGSDAHVKAQHLEHYRGYNIWRFDITILCGVPQRTVEYMVIHDKDHSFFFQHRYRFRVPGVSQKWRWGFYSCNGFHDHEVEADMGGIQPLWRDVNHCHEEKPIHVMVGGGDQLYCDDVWNLPSLVQWLEIPDKTQRLGYPFTHEMSEQVEWYYFTAYIKHWTQPRFKDALASIPQVMMWDDHDIFDGWGSYPVELQFCPVFQGVFFFARKFYCLFQQHSTPERIYDHNQVFGEFGWNWLGCFGSTTAVLMLDARTERSIETCVRPGSWVMIQQRLAALPKTVRHVIILAPVPVMYPQISIIESSLNFLTGKGRTQQAVVALMQKTGLCSHIYNQFGLPDLLDDLADHWSAGAHEAEKLMMLHMLQNLAQARGFRFTFLSGDVHVAALGRFCTRPITNLKTDHRFMPQIISSAIGNAPPPSAVVKALMSQATTRILDPHTQEMLIKGFNNNQVLKGARNWCLVGEDQLVAGKALNRGALTFQLRVEKPEQREQRPEVFEWVVPVLDLIVGPHTVNKLKPLPMPGPPPLSMLGQHQQNPNPSMGPYGSMPPTTQPGRLPSSNGQLGSGGQLHAASNLGYGQPHQQHLQQGAYGGSPEILPQQQGSFTPGQQQQLQQQGSFASGQSPQLQQGSFAPGQQQQGSYSPGQHQQLQQHDSFVSGQSPHLLQHGSFVPGQQQQGSYSPGQHQQPQQQGSFVSGQSPQLQQQGSFTPVQQQPPQQQRRFVPGQQQQLQQQGSYSPGQQQQPQQQGSFASGQSPQLQQQGSFTPGQQQQPQQQGSYSPGQQQQPQQQGSFVSGQSPQLQQQGSFVPGQQQQGSYSPGQQQQPQRRGSFATGQPSQLQQQGSFTSGQQQLGSASSPAQAGHGLQQPGYGQQQSGYGQQQLGYGSQKSAYGTQQPNYNLQQPLLPTPYR